MKIIRLTRVKAGEYEHPQLRVYRKGRDWTVHETGGIARYGLQTLGHALHVAGREMHCLVVVSQKLARRGV